jgi:hypothetical protein
MQYAIISMINGNWKIEVETNDLQQAKVNFHDKCKILWNASDVTLARVWIVDQSLGLIDYEEITHAAKVTEPEA